MSWECIGHNVMNAIEPSNWDAKSRDDDHDVESQVTRVEFSDNFVVISNELEYMDPFYVIFCTKPLHTCEETFEDDQGNTWYKGKMMLKGVRYYKVASQ